MITYLEKIMKSKMLKLFQGHVIACSHVLISHGLLKPFPSQILVFNKVHRNSLRRLRRGRHNSFGRRNSDRFRWIYIMDLDGRLLRGRKNRKARLGWPVLCPLFLVTTWKIFQVNCLWQIFSLIPNSRTRLRFGLRPSYLVHYLLTPIFFHGCHHWKEKR